jgi:tetratricopeptide (TPR) repeat protein
MVLVGRGLFLATSCNQRRRSLFAVALSVTAFARSAFAGDPSPTTTDSDEVRSSKEASVAHEPSRLLAENSSSFGALSQGSATPQGATAAEDGAIELAYRGRQQFDSGDYRAAVQSFRESLSHARSPVVELYLARAERALGLWLEAKQTLAASLLTFPETENQIWIDARRDAENELKDLSHKMPRARITVAGLPLDQVPQLYLDNAEQAFPKKGVLELNPGEHRVAVAWGSERLSSAVIAREDQELVVHFAFLGRSAAPEVTQVEAEPAPKAALSPTPDQGPNLVPWTWAAFSVASASALVGTFVGVAAIQKGNELLSWCREMPGRCPNNEPVEPEKASLRFDAMAMATLANTSFVAAGVFAVTGVTLFVIEKNKRAPAQITTRGASLHLLINF